MSYKEKSAEKAVGSERSGWLCDLLDASHPRFIAGIGPAKWHGIPQHASGVFAVGNDQRSGQKQKESVVPVWLI
jgi:hypothetical protein